MESLDTAPFVRLPLAPSFQFSRFRIFCLLSLNRLQFVFFFFSAIALRNQTKTFWRPCMPSCLLAKQIAGSCTVRAGCSFSLVEPAWNGHDNASQQHEVFSGNRCLFRYYAYSILICAGLKNRQNRTRINSFRMLSLLRTLLVANTPSKRYINFQRRISYLYVRDTFFYFEEHFVDFFESLKNHARACLFQSWFPVRN